MERLRQRDARKTEADRKAAARVSEATQRSRERKRNKVRGAGFSSSEVVAVVAAPYPPLRLFPCSWSRRSSAVRCPKSGCSTRRWSGSSARRMSPAGANSRRLRCITVSGRGWPWPRSRSRLAWVSVALLPWRAALAPTQTPHRTSALHCRLSAEKLWQKRQRAARQCSKLCRCVPLARAKGEDPGMPRKRRLTSTPRVRRERTVATQDHVRAHGCLAPGVAAPQRAAAQRAHRQASHAVGAQRRPLAWRQQDSPAAGQAARHHRVALFR